jgi:signal peptidase II
MKKLRHFIYVLLLIGFDQLTKYLAVVNLKGQDSFKLIPNVLHFHYHENNGAVWGILSGQIIFLAIFTSIIVCALIYFYLKLPEEKHYNLLRILTMLIIAGAIGNLIDRIRLQYVIDFIYFALIDFPIFNIADSYVTVSSILLMISILFYYKDEDFKFLGRSR